MTRVSGAAATTLDSRVVRRLHMVKLDFASGAVLAHDGIGSITYAGDTYLGIGEFGSIEAVTEDIAVRPQTVTLNLTGVDATLLGDLFADEYHLRDALLYLQLIDERNQADGDPVLLWSGYMDFATIELGEQTAAVSMRCMDRLADLSRPRPFYLTDEAQQRRYAGDLGLEFAPQAVRETRVDWGGTPYSAPVSGGDPGDGGGRPRAIP